MAGTLLRLDITLFRPRPLSLFLIGSTGLVISCYFQCSLQRQSESKDAFLLDKPFFFPSPNLGILECCFPLLPSPRDSERLRACRQRKWWPLHLSARRTPQPPPSLRIRCNVTTTRNSRTAEIPAICPPALHGCGLHLQKCLFYVFVHSYPFPLACVFLCCLYFPCRKKIIIKMPQPETCPVSVLAHPLLRPMEVLRGSKGKTCLRPFYFR